MQKLLLIALLSFFTDGLFAQNYTKAEDSDPKAKEALGKMRKKYTAYDVLEADFSLEIEVPEQPKEVQKGTTGIYSNSPIGRIGEAAAQRNKMMKELGYEKGGSMFGTESSNIDPMTDIRNRVKALEDIIAVTAITSAKQPTAKPPAPRSAPRSAPVGATSETSSDVSSAAIINIVAGSGQTAPVQEASQSSQSTAEYASNPWPSGLAGVICTSPWSIV